jgi:hypothetical protein
MFRIKPIPLLTSIIVLKLIKGEHSEICLILKTFSGPIISVITCELFSHHSIERGIVNKYSYFKIIPVHHKLPNTELTGDFGMMSLARVKMIPPNGKIHHKNNI